MNHWSYKLWMASVWTKWQQQHPKPTHKDLYYRLYSVRVLPDWYSSQVCFSLCLLPALRLSAHAHIHQSSKSAWRQNTAERWKHREREREGNPAKREEERELVNENERSRRGWWPIKKHRDGVRVRGKGRVKEIKRKDWALQVSSEASCSLIIERRAAAERDNQSACSASVLC